MTNDTMAALVDTWDGVQQQIASLMEQRGRIQQAMEQSMAADRAEEFSFNSISVTLKPESLWVEGSLEPLAELLPGQGLDMEDYLQRPQVRKFDKRKLTKLAKQGGEIRDVIEAAKVDGAPVLKVKRG